METTYKIPRATIIFSTILFVALIGGAFASYAATGTGGGGGGKGSKSSCSGAGVLSAEEVASFPASPSGKACGVIKLCDEGQQVVSYDALPNCPGSVTVWCMNSEGQWVNSTVGEVGTSADGTALVMDIQQVGHCGIFPAAASLNGPVIYGN